MRIQPKIVSICLLAALAASASGAIADVVVLNPAEITGQVSFSPETVTQFRVEANSTDGLQGSKSFTTNPYSLTVESGHDYNPLVYAYFNNPTASESFLRVYRTSTVNVNNANGPTTVNFNYPSTSRINFSVNVTGGTVRGYYIDAKAAAGTDDYWARSSRWFSSPLPATVSGWSVMIPDDWVDVDGTVHLTAADGTELQRSLTKQTINLLQGQGNVSWSVDLTNKGTLAGDVELTSTAGISGHTLQFYGLSGTSTSGIYGSKSISANGSYSISLLPGTYDVYLRTNFTSPSSWSETKSYRVTIGAGSTTTRDFVEIFGAGQAPLNVSGFFSNAQLSSAQVRLRRKDPAPSIATMAESYTLANGQLNFSLSSGDWRRDLVRLSLYDLSNPELPLNNTFYRYHINDSGAQPINVPAGGSVTFGSEDVTLVKTNVYFDVTEASPEDPEILLSSPYILAYRHAYGADNTLQQYNQVYAYGSSDAKGLSALTMVAEPGVYIVNAYATVNGSSTELSAQNITFADPVPTSAGTDVSVTPLQSEDRVVNLTFSSVTSPGITTVVETPMGPEAPEGLKAFCEDGARAEGIECNPIYYDIKTTATFDAPATVCVRRKFLGANGLSAFLRLYHYNENAPPGGSGWERLDPPAGQEAATDCSADLQACGCADEASCGIDYNADPPVSVIQVCGVTTSFSPFGIFEERLKFTNEVNGQSHEGPTGPIQTWTVPADGVYRITATGARGAAAVQALGRAGGCGAEIAGTFTLQGGDELKILVGQKGTSAPYSGGGGGGSFVVLNNAPLIIAGGGGGVRSGATVDGRHAGIGTAGVAGSLSANYTTGLIAGGTNGSGGSKASSYGSGGGGFSASGASDGAYGEGGFSFLLGGKGGAGKSCGALAHGGFGGGGAGNGCYGGGGGGGYSGGGSGRVGGGGGSWSSGADPEGKVGLETCTPSGHGVVTIGFDASP